MARVVRRKTYRRKTYRRKAAWYDRKYSTAQIARAAWRATKYIRGLVNSERMYLDSTITLASKANTYLLNAVPIGDNVANRTGNSILVRSLYMRGFININPSVTVSTRVSLALVQDLQQVSDSIPSELDMFTSNNPEAQLRVGATTNTAGRFKIMWRKNYLMIPGQKPTITLDKFWKLYTHCKYNGSSGSDVQKNGLYLVILTSESTNFPTVNITTRLGYHDN